MCLRTAYNLTVKFKPQLQGLQSTTSHLGWVTTTSVMNQKYINMILAGWSQIFYGNNEAYCAYHQRTTKKSTRESYVETYFVSIPLFPLDLLGLSASKQQNMKFNYSGEKKSTFFGILLEI